MRNVFRKSLETFLSIRPVMDDEFDLFHFNRK